MTEKEKQSVRSDIEIASDILLSSLDYIDDDDPDDALGGIYEAFDRINRTIATLDELT